MKNNRLNNISSLLVILGGLLSFSKHKKVAAGAVGVGLIGLLVQLFINKNKPS
jgi:hypothetical protein